MKRGFLKYYILKLLSEENLTGYGLMKRIEEETGFWKPSTGSMYPLLQALEDQGLIAQEEGGKAYRLTERGESALAEAHRAKAEILESLQRACEVFGRIFSEEEVKGVHHLIRGWEGGPHGPEHIPDSLRPRLILLRHMLLSLPYEALGQEQIREINEVLELTLAKLAEHLER